MSMKLGCWSCFAKPGRRVLGRAMPAAGMLALAALLAGCSSDSQVLARVGDRTITTADFFDVASRNQNLYTASPDSAKLTLLQDLVRRSLLVQEAKREGLTADSLARGEIEEQVLGGALGERLVPRSIPVSEAEIRQLYDWRGMESHIRVIYTVERNRAEAARAELERGVDFKEVADRYSLAGLLPPGGDLGFLAPGSLVDPLDGYLREGPVGQVVGPVRAPGEGWFLIEVLERRPRPQPPFERMQMTLAEMLRQRKQRALSTRAFEGLRDQYHVRVEPDGPHVMFAWYNVPTGEDGRVDRPRPTPQEQARVLARYDGGPGHRGVYTFRDALEDLDRSSMSDRPNPNLLPSFDQWIQGRVLRRVAVIEAKRRHLDREPDLARRIEEQLNDRLLDSIYETRVVSEAQATEADVLDVYRKQADALARLDWVKLQHLTIPDSLSAVHVLERARSAPSLREAFLLSSPGLEVREETVRFPAEDPVWASLRSRFLTMNPGLYDGPVRVDRGWRIYQMVDKQQVRQRFEDLPPGTQRSLRNEAEELARDRRLTALCDSLEQSFGVTRYPERLRNLPWPPRGPAG